MRVDLETRYPDPEFPFVYPSFADKLTFGRVTPLQIYSP
jgi:hypothetical protein